MIEEEPLQTFEHTLYVPGYLSDTVLHRDFMPLLVPLSPIPCRNTTGMAAVSLYELSASFTTDYHCCT